MTDALEPSASAIDTVPHDDLTPSRPASGTPQNAVPRPPARQGGEADAGVMSLVDHLAELRGACSSACSRWPSAG